MKSTLWAAAVALPLMLVGCGPKEEAKPVVEAPVTVEPKKDEVVSTTAVNPKFTTEQKEKLRAPLKELAAKYSGGKVTFGAAAPPSRWTDFLGKDLPIYYASCTVVQDCHLQVDPVGVKKQGKPPRWLRFEKNNDGTIWASIRSGVDARERMECDSLEVDEEFLSGWCTVKPHAGTGSHWFTFLLYQESAGHGSVSYVFYDKEPKGDGSDVHNGEGHGGTE